MIEKEIIHRRYMDIIQAEWKDREKYHKCQRLEVKGVRSSQISALVMVLVEMGVLK